MMTATPTLNVLIVDDEAPARARLSQLLADCAAVLPVSVAGEAATGREALESLAQLPVDVILLDIRMPGMDGIEVAQHAQRLPVPPAIIFTTACDSHALQAFELNAIDYLLKPIRAERLLAALRKAAALTPAHLQALQGLTERPRGHLSVYQRGRIILVPAGEIVYLRAELKYITLRTLAAEYLLEESLSSLEQEFPDLFVRIHRNCLVAKSAITGFEKAEVAGEEGQGWRVLLKGLPEKLPLSRRQQHVLRLFR